MKSAVKAIAKGVLTVVVLGCVAAGPAQPATRPSSEPPRIVIPTTGVRSITLPAFDIQLPKAPGQLTYLSACMLCHTPRYVLMQPAFPKKTWVAEVEKMRKVYGAPIQDEQVEPIVKYLGAVRGNGE